MKIEPIPNTSSGNLLELLSLCSEAFVPTLGLRLVGPFELLGVNRPTPAPASHLCHYRCYYDPPEFLTVVAGDEKTQFHMGYFRCIGNQQISLNINIKQDMK